MPSKRDAEVGDWEAGTMTPGESQSAIEHQEQLARDFSILGVISLAWNCINVFGGLSFIFVVGLSAGGLPAIFYG